MGANQCSVEDPVGGRLHVFEALGPIEREVILVEEPHHGVAPVQNVVAPVCAN